LLTSYSPSDDEKFLFKPAAKLEDNYKYGHENIKDIIACGVKLEKTFIFSDVDYVG
jgi:tryptophanyl-tRNA synthetase